MSTPSRKALQTQLPKGAKLYLPDEAGQKRHVEETLLTVFRRWGYREIVTPAYEYFDVLSQGTSRTSGATASSIRRAWSWSASRMPRATPR